MSLSSGDISLNSIPIKEEGESELSDTEGGGEMKNTDGSSITKPGAEDDKVGSCPPMADILIFDLLGSRLLFMSI